MSLEELKESVPEENNKSAGRTNVRLDSHVVSKLKKEVGVSKNNEVAPAIGVAISEFIDDNELADEYREEFENQFEDE